MINIEDFLKVHIKIGKVLSAERIEGSDKLIKFTFDIGNGEVREILGGLATSYPDPSVLVGKEMPVIINLEPRKMMGLISQGMIMAASGETGPVTLHPATEVPPGSEVR